MLGRALREGDMAQHPEVVGLDLERRQTLLESARRLKAELGEQERDAPHPRPLVRRARAFLVPALPSHRHSTIVSGFYGSGFEGFGAGSVSWGRRARWRGADPPCRRCV